MNVVVLGAGFAGYNLIKGLVKDESINKITVIDKSQSRLKKTKKLGDKIFVYNSSIEEVDRIRKFISRSDLVIVALPPSSKSIDIIRACIDEGTHYMDLGISDYTLLFTIYHDDIFHDAGIFAFPSYGADPGLTNILAKHASKDLDMLDEILIRDGSVSYDGTGNYYVYSPIVFFQELIERPLVYMNGNYIRLNHNESIENFYFPINIGYKKVKIVSHEEVITLPKFLGKKIMKVNFGYYIPDTIEKGFKEFEINNKVKFDKLKALSSIRNNNKLRGFELLVIKITGSKKDEKISRQSFIYLDHQEAVKRFNENATEYLVTYLPLKVIKMLAERKLKGAGVVLPEMLETEEIINDLKDLGIYFYEETKKEIEEIKI